MAHCMRHYEEPVVDHCRTCHKPYCSRCLVFAFGPNKPPYCVGCALTASGVRNKGAKVIVAPAEAGPDRRVERAQRRAEKAEAKALQRATKRAGKHGEPAAPAADAGPRSTNIPVPKGLTTPASRFAPPSEHVVS